MTRERRKLKTGGRKHIPLPLGPHSVGCVDLMTGYSKNGCFVRLFYPTQKPTYLKKPEQLWTPWLPHQKYLNGYSQFLRVWTPIFKSMYRITVGDVYIPAVWDADPLTSRPLPVVIFSHGLAACRTSYSTLCVELASHGYMVAAIEHRDNSACNSYYMKEVPRRGSGDIQPIREWVLYKNISLKQKEYPIRNKQVRQRAKECLRTLDLLESLNKGYVVDNVLNPLFAADRFKGTMDLERVAVAGHSFGGATAILALSLELRFKVGLALDTWMLPLYKDDDVMSMVSQPMLFVNMEKFQTKENLEALSKLDSDQVERKVVTVKGSIHLNQCDMPFVCGTLSTTVLSGFSRVNRFTAVDLTSRLMLNFLAKHFGHDVPSGSMAYLEKHQRKLFEGIGAKSH